MRKLSDPKERENLTLVEITKTPLTFRKIPKSAQTGSKSTLYPVTFTKTQNSKASLRVYSNSHFKSKTRFPRLHQTLNFGLTKGPRTELRKSKESIYTY